MSSHIANLSVKCHRVNVSGHSIFYRESGPKNGPTILLLSGYPMSSFYFRNLMPLLSDSYHLIAPDFPGFGFTTSPSNFSWTFAAIADVMQSFTDKIGLKKYAIYIFDYGSPIGLRMAIKDPSRITAIISQNGNAYEEGLTAAWDPIKKYWNQPTAENRQAISVLLHPDTIKQLFYLQGNESDGQEDLVGPESYTLDSALLNNPGQSELQLDLFGDYKTNVALYPTFHSYFRDHQPPTLVIWGRHDPFFSPAGAQAYQRDLPKATVKFLEAGHTALEARSPEIATEIRAFFKDNKLN